MTAGTNGGYGRGRPRFSDEERKQLLAAYDGGESVVSIARRLGCTPAAIYYHLRTTLRHVPMRDRFVHAPAARGGARTTSHHSWAETKVQAESPDSLGLTLADLRRFLADAEEAGIPERQHISVGGVSVHSESYGQKECWASRISVRATDAEIQRAADRGADQ